MESIQAATDYMHKEAKEAFFKRVMASIRDQKSKKWPMRYKQDFLLAFRYYLAGYNKLAQKYNVPFGVLLYTEVHSSYNAYNWLNALNPSNMQRKRAKAVADLWQLIFQRATAPGRYMPSSEIVEVFKNQLTTLENT